MNDENLQPIKKGELTREEAKRRGSNGGKASGKARRERKTMRETAEYLLNLPQKPGKVTTFDKLKTNKDISDANLINQDQIILKQIEQARKGNIRSAEFLRDLVGEDVSQSVVSPLDRLAAVLEKYQEDEDE